MKPATLLPAAFRHLRRLPFRTWRGPRRHGAGLAALPGCMLALSLLALASPAAAEKLDLDHRVYPPLHAALESPGDQTVFYDASRAGVVFDRILIEGRSAERDWTEALELTVFTRPRALREPAQWYAAFAPTAETPCPAKAQELTRDASSLTFALDASACPAGSALTGLYRVVLGKKSVYLVAAKRKGAITPEQRAQWLALLGSAHLSP